MARNFFENENAYENLIHNISNSIASIVTERKRICSGRVIDNYWILTAANCTLESNSTRSFVGGTHFLSVKSLRLSNFHFHPNVSRKTSENGLVYGPIAYDLVLVRTRIYTIFNKANMKYEKIYTNYNLPMTAVGCIMTSENTRWGFMTSINVLQIPFWNYSQISGNILGPVLNRA